MEISDYVKLTNKIDKLIDENYKLKYRLDIYKQECILLNEKLRDGRRKFYRNRKLFEELIDIVLLTIDEDLLKKSTNLSYKTAKKEILKMYDEDIKYN